MNPQAFAHRCQRIYEIGCICCRQRGYFKQPCQVQHLNLDEHAGQERLGDEHTIGLCPWHHVGEPSAPWDEESMAHLFGPSMKHEPVRFRKVFGSDQDLLREQNRLIEIAESKVIGKECI